MDMVNHLEENISKRDIKISIHSKINTISNPLFRMAGVKKSPLEIKDKENKH